MSTRATEARGRLGPWARGLAALALALSWPLAAAGQVGLRNSAHDFSASSTAAVKSNERQMCKFCHTPHGALSTNLLWNHRPSSTTYNWGGQTTTFSGTPLPSTINEPSKKCLSCHDGSVALAELVNDGTPGNTSTTVFTGPAGRLEAGALRGVNVVVGAGGDVSHGHPFSIPYAGNAYGGITSGVPPSSPEYQAVLAGGSCRTATGICTGAAAGGSDGTVIQLYPATAGSLNTTTTGIECGTCHEPHNQYGNRWLMRLDAATTDNLCSACHIK